MAGRAAISNGCCSLPPRVDWCRLSTASAVERRPRRDQPARRPRRVRQDRGRAVSLLDRVNLGDLLDPGREPDKTALIAVDPDGNARHFSYRTLERAITALSSDLARRGVRRGARVALLGINSAEYL